MFEDWKNVKVFKSDCGSLPMLLSKFETRHSKVILSIIVELREKSFTLHHIETAISLRLQILCTRFLGRSVGEPFVYSLTAKTAPRFGMNFSRSAKLSEGGVVAAYLDWNEAKPTRKNRPKKP